jgi:DNA-binding transcriptional MerR regulator
MRDLMTSKEAAVYLRISEDTLRRWRCRGLGPKYIRINGRILYRLRDLERFLDLNECGSAAA